MTNRIGVDLGGTKIEAVVLDPDNRELRRRRVPTPQGDYDGTIEAVRHLVEDVSAGLETVDAVGIGTPGSISPFDGLMKNANSVVLNGRAFDVDLRTSLHRSILMRNDADCFTLSESVDGAAAGCDMVFGVIIGTGVGGGIAAGGRAWTGPNRVAGEWGHNPLPWPTDEERPGPDCYCGKTGCVETWLSGPGFAQDAARTTGLQRSAPEVVAAARNGDRGAVQSLERYCDRLARALATVVNVVDPEVVVLGGGMSNVKELYERVPALWDRYVFGGEVATRLVQNLHGDSSGVRGAAMLVPT